VPNTLVGLLIFVALLTPGVCYNFRREGNRPIGKTPTVLRETARLVITGLTADAIALAMFAAFRRWQPEHTPDPRRLISTPGPYFRGEYGYLLLWAAGLLLLACLIATLLAAIRTTRWMERLLSSGVLGWLFKQSVTTEPAWWQMFNSRIHPTKARYVGCELTDGAYLGGRLYSFSPDSAETADRELTLSAPITYRPVDGDDARDLEVSALIVSARQIKFLTVTYVDTDAIEAPAPESADATAEPPPGRPPPAESIGASLGETERAA
jgi:Family of unknown function (DUF6338)